MNEILKLEDLEPDSVVDLSPTGRTRRHLDVCNRRMRLMASQDSRKRDQWMGRDSVEPPPENRIYDFFDRVVVINLDNRQDRMDRLDRHFAEVGWPFRQPQRFSAIDGRYVKPPSWWKAGAPAWGCMRSHLQIIERALMDQVNSVLILEDDVFFQSDFVERAKAFFEAVPNDWQQIYLGGQHLHQRRQLPKKVNEEVVQPYNVNRTHAYALHRRGMLPVYRFLTDYVAHSKKPSFHVDHRLGLLHESGSIKLYAPVRWIAGQYRSMSNITGRVMGSRIWNQHKVDDEADSSSDE